MLTKVKRIRKKYGSGDGVTTGGTDSIFGKVTEKDKVEHTEFLKKERRKKEALSKNDSSKERVLIATESKKTKRKKRKVSQNFLSQ